MNVVILPRARTRFAYICYLHNWGKAGVFFGLLALSFVLLGSGYFLGMSYERKENLNSVEQGNQSTIDTLTARVASLQAHVSHIDALANMLVNTAGLDAEEFSFDSILAMGGPHSSFENVVQVDMEIDTVLERLAAGLKERDYQLQALNDLLVDKKFALETYPQGWPVIHGWVSSYFGKRKNPFTGKVEMHKGMDFAGKLGSDVVAVAGGIVTQVDKNGGYGNMIEIDHGNGYATRYGHNKAILVHVGEAIKRGQVIAKLGSTGRSTGPHVHFEVLKDGVRVDPIKFTQ